MSGFSELILKVLKDKVILFTLHRDPLFMIQQNIFNVENFMELVETFNFILKKINEIYHFIL